MKMMLWCIILVFNVIDLSAKPDFLVKLEIEKNNGIFWVHTTIINNSKYLISMPVTAIMGIDGHIDGQSPSWITLDAWTEAGQVISDQKNKINYYIEPGSGMPYIRLKSGESYTRSAPLIGCAYPLDQGYFDKEIPGIHTIQAKVHLAYFLFDQDRNMIGNQINVEDILSNKIVLE